MKQRGMREEEIDVLVREVQSRNDRIYGHANRPPWADDAKASWEEISTAMNQDSNGTLLNGHALSWYLGSTNAAIENRGPVPAFHCLSFDSCQISADLLLLEEYAQVRREQVFRDCRDLLMESDEWLTCRFRLPRQVLLDLCHNSEARLQRDTRQSNALPVPVQVVATIGFLATGTFQREIGDRAGVSQPTMSRVMPDVLAAIKSFSRDYIQFLLQ
ncbi:hypothetical protein H4Q32_026559 [Xyrichtys novacula]|uniref:Nuclease HARBI1 n=1 Tax=Xyrichtys novacula TaxID=13765 RepID=A0AAV1ET13_XYRNO|nr:hypothetical protein H4Q32_026559 [Xyrichtys novacula]